MTLNTLAQYWWTQTTGLVYIYDRRSGLNGHNAFEIFWILFSDQLKRRLMFTWLNVRGNKLKRKKDPRWLQDVKLLLQKQSSTKRWVFLSYNLTTLGFICEPWGGLALRYACMITWLGASLTGVPAISRVGAWPLAYLDRCTWEM